MRIKDYQTIIDLCDQIQEKTPYGVFLNISGHISWVDVDISVSKKEYLTFIFRMNVYKEGISKCEKRLKEILEDGLTSLSLTKMADENKIKEAFESQCSLGVSKRRSIANIAKEFELTQKQIKTIIGL